MSLSIGPGVGLSLELVRVGAVADLTAVTVVVDSDTVFRFAICSFDGAL